MNFALVVSIILAALAVTFSIQNAQPVQVNFLSWYFNGPLVVVLLLTFATGLVASLLASIPSRFRRSRELADCRRRLQQLEKASRQEQPPSPPAPAA